MRKNLKFIGGIILVLSFLIQCTITNWLDVRIEKQSTAIQSHQYLDIIGRLQMLDYKVEGLPQDPNELKNLAGFTSHPLAQILNGAFLEEKDIKSIKSELNDLQEKITDIYSYANFHNRVVELDSKYCDRTTELKKKYETIQNRSIWIFNVLYALGLVLISIGEFKPYHQKL